MNILAASVDGRDEAQKTVHDLGLSFPVAHGLNPEETARTLGGYLDQEKQFLHPAGFVIRPSGTIEVACFSSGPIGRLSAGNVLSMVKYYKQNRD